LYSQYDIKKKKSNVAPHVLNLGWSFVGFVIFQVSPTVIWIRMTGTQLRSAAF